MLSGFRAWEGIGLSSAARVRWAWGGLIGSLGEPSLEATRGPMVLGTWGREVRV